MDFSKSIWYPTENKNILEAVHGHVTYFEVSGDIGGAAVIQEGIKLDGLTVVIRKLLLTDDLILKVENPKPCIGFHFILEGTFEFQDVNDITSVLITPGMFLPIEWKATKGKKKFSGPNYHSLEVFFNRVFLESLLGKGNKPRCDYFTQLTDNPNISTNQFNKSISEKLKNSLMAIVSCPYEDSVKISYLECKIRWLLIDLLMNNEHCSYMNEILDLPKSDYLSIQKVVQYIEKNLKKRLTIKELSEVVGYNTTKLKSNFKIVHKTTIFKYITQLRMESAKTLILKENITIAQASYEVGYSNPQHFTTAFKKTMGYLPSELKPVFQ